MTPPTILEADYERVLATLGTLISGRSRGDGRAWEWEHAMEVMDMCLERLDLARRLPSLHVIHVTGTKGKGSTCALTEAALRASGYRTGLFTSPHLWDVRERIRVDGRPVDKATFVRHFDAVYKRLEETADDRVGVPAYFKFLTLLGLSIFVDAGLDAVILEVGIGGRLDATNCVPPPVAAGVAPLGFDHMELLGDTLPAIASEKAGIFKPGSAAFTVAQRPDAAASLAGVAAGVGVPLALARPLDEYKPAAGAPPPPFPVGLAGAHQRVNASLAVALAGAFDAWAVDGLGRPDAAERAAALGRGELPASYAAGLAAAAWHGRGEVVHDGGGQGADAATGGLSFYLDGAHTPESAATCAHWFADAAGGGGAGGGGGAARPPPTASPSTDVRLLLFNCMHEREPRRLLAPLAETLAARGAPLAGALFVPPDSTYAKLGPGDPPVDLTWQQSLAALWQADFAGGVGGAARQQQQQPPKLPPVPGPAGALVDPAAGAVAPSVKSALEWLRSATRARPGVRLRVLVTGSLYLVGDVLRHLGRSDE